MNEIEIGAMKIAMSTIKAICEKNHGVDCWQCPANGHGRLCHSGELSCCAPHGWWDVEEAEHERDDK
jgi:hypothetical protein